MEGDFDTGNMRFKAREDILSASAIGVLCSEHPAHKQIFSALKGDIVALLLPLT